MYCIAYVKYKVIWQGKFPSEVSVVYVLKAGYLVSYLFLYKCFVCLLYVLGWRDGGEEGGYLCLCFFSIIYILGLVCYKHTIHVAL